MVIATTLILVRHAESTWNPTGRYQGRIDTELSEQGQRQAFLVAERLRLLPLNVIFTSPLRRALHTAIAISSPHNLDVRVENDLTEIDHGAWGGLLKEEVEKRFGPILQQWLMKPSQVQMPGGESLFQVSQRASGVIQRILASYSEGRVAVCTHDAVLKAILLQALGLNLDSFWNLGIDNASISILEFDAGDVRLVVLNDTCHLGGLRSATSEQAL
ncbi:MAG: histidine phosphatase family protein [Chloroflexi bacterium]|nr:histidine phosphatase family protein [Chloroflexota bacterium]